MTSWLCLHGPLRPGEGRRLQAIIALRSAGGLGVHNLEEPGFLTRTRNCRNVGQRVLWRRFHAVPVKDAVGAVGQTLEADRDHAGNVDLHLQYARGVLRVGPGEYIDSVSASGGTSTVKVAPAGPLQRVPLRARATIRLFVWMITLLE